MTVDHPETGTQRLTALCDFVMAVPIANKILNFIKERQLCQT